MSGLLRNDGAGQAFLLVIVVGQAFLPVNGSVKAHTGFMNTTTDNNAGPALFEQ